MITQTEPKTEANTFVISSSSPPSDTGDVAFDVAERPSNEAVSTIDAWIGSDVGYPRTVIRLTTSSARTPPDLLSTMEEIGATPPTHARATARRG
jgi:hypothetical protein